MDDVLVPVRGFNRLRDNYSDEGGCKGPNRLFSITLH